jgi:ubiquitin carboxyl-terminal hydrolase 5/13
LFSHPDDTGEDVDAVPPLPAAAAVTVTLPAQYRLCAFISHKGPSVHSGHYVAHIRTDDGGWVLFNDEKVVRADEGSLRALRALAYLYVFEKVPQHVRAAVV